MLDEVLERVHKMASNEEQEDIASNFKYEWQPGIDVNNNNEDEEQTYYLDEYDDVQDQDVQELVAPQELIMGEAMDTEIYDENENNNINKHEAYEKQGAPMLVEEGATEEVDQPNNNDEDQDVMVNPNVNDDDSAQDNIEECEVDDKMNHDNEPTVQTCSSNRQRANLDYAVLHNTGIRKERQMHQVCKQLKKLTKSKNQNPKIKLEVRDMFCKVIGITISQTAKADKYAQVSVKEGIR
jgi:hypothetical protein